MSHHVCVQPEAVLRLISAIGVPPAAQRRAYVNTTLGPRPVHTMSRAIVLSRLRSLHPLSHCTDADLLRMLSFMQELDLCFELGENERSVRVFVDCFVFPSVCYISCLLF